MKQDLWLVNSSLVFLFVLALCAYELLLQEPSPWRIPRIVSLEELEKKKEAPRPELTWDQIYQEDLFDTFIAPIMQPTKKSFVTPIPEPRPAIIPPPPDIKKQEFIPPLTITVRGIIAGGDESRNVAMIADEANKEGMYYLGEKIKDAQIIKIAHNRVVLLRSNGQQEIFYLRKDDAPSLDQQPAERWQFVVKKINESGFEVNPYEFVKEVETLGQFIERFSIVGTAFQSGSVVGLRIGKIEANDIAFALGIMENDIITSINDISVAEQKNRIKIYDTIVSLPLGQTIKVNLKRSDKDVSLSYKLVKIDRPRKKLMFTGASTASEPQGSVQPPTGAAQKDDPFKMNRLQQREQNMREFNKIHPDTQKNTQAMMEIRRRILENLQNRAR